MTKKAETDYTIKVNGMPKASDKAAVICALQAFQ